MTSLPPCHPVADATPTCPPGRRSAIHVHVLELQLVEEPVDNALFLCREIALGLLAKEPQHVDDVARLLEAHLASPRDRIGIGAERRKGLIREVSDESKERGV